MGRSWYSMQLSHRPAAARAALLSCAAALLLHAGGVAGPLRYGGVGPMLTRTRSCGRSHLRNASCTAAASRPM
jgi:hypothetical protein